MKAAHLRLGAMLALALVGLVVGAASSPAAGSPNLVISQVYGGGGNMGATFANDFIEIFNRGTTDAPLNGLSVQYASASGTGNFGSNNQLTELPDVTLPAGKYFLVQEAGGTTGAPLPPADVVDSTNPINLSGSAGKVVLVTGTASLGCNGSTAQSCSAEALARIVDLVGYGTANFFEGTAAAPGLTSSTAAVRNDDGCTDTDNNSADFTASTPLPRTTATQPRSCGTTSPGISVGTTPSNPTRGSAMTIRATITRGANPASSGLQVTCDLSWAGLTGTAVLFDDGTNGDATAGDLVFSRQFTIPPATPTGVKSGDCHVSDAEGRGDSAPYQVNVTEPLVVVSEVYGGGGNSGAQFKNDFIELYNRGTTDAPLSGWSVQYASATGTTWQVTPLGSFTLRAGQHYLVHEAPGTGTAPDLPPADASGTIAMAASSGKVALVRSTTPLDSCISAAIVDLVGYGTASCSETAPTPTLSNTTSAKRNGGGATDTNNNQSDFTVGAPEPQNSGTGDAAPTVSTRSPASGATGVAVDASINVGFSEGVNVADGWYTISCTTSGAHTATPSGGPQSFTLDPDENFASGETCTVTIVATKVTDQDATDPPDTMAADDVFSFQTATASACGDAATPIDVIQGSGAASDRVGQTVTIEGVVVGDYQLTPSEFNGFYVEEETGDGDTDPATSEGIFVFGGGVGVNRGDLVRVRGTVAEFNGLTQLTSVSAVVVCPGSANVPTTQVSLPVAAVTDLERYEGMLVDFNQTLTVTEVFNLGRFGEVSLSGAGRLYTPTAVAAPGAPAQAVAAQNDRSRIILDDANNQQNIDPTRYPQGGLSATNTLRVGDSLNGLTGVMDFRFSAYRIQPVGPISFDHTNARAAAPAPVGGNLKVASFNVLNYFNGDGAGGGFPTARGATNPQEFARQRAKEISALKAMNADIVGLMEMENDAPPNSAVEDLVAGLNDAMGAGTYSFVNTGVIGTDAIKVALIYKPGSVTPVGAYKLMTSAVDPRFVDTLNRPSLAQTFRQNSTGGKLTVVVNHLKSKSSACAGDPDTGDGQGECNMTRTRAAAALADWLKTDPTGSGDPDFLLIGDMNAYAFEDPITAFTDAGLRNVVRERDGLSAYSYVFDGESGYLDHAIATPSLVSQITGVEHWHINPDEPTVLDYNTEFKTANQVNTFYDAGPYRSSDHDPVLIGLFFNSAPTADAGGPYTVAEGGSVSVSATGSDADGDTLAYAWDLDDNGSFETPGQTVTYSAGDGPATRTIHVRVSDASSSATDDATVTVTNVAPEATFSAPATALAGFPFTLSLTSPHDPSAADTAAGFTYAFDCGSGYGSFGSASTASCTPTDTGALSVAGKIRDKDGDVSEYRGTVDVTVTFTSLCELVKAYTTDGQLITQLCQRLDQAAKAETAAARAAHLATFEDRVEKSGAFTAAQVAILQRLADRLL